MRRYRSALAIPVLLAALLTATPVLAQQWSFQAEALWLQRDVNPGVATSVEENRDIVALGTDNLGFGFSPGARFTLGFHPNPNNTFELSYFGLHQWSDDAAFARADSVDTVFDDQSYYNDQVFSNADTHTIKYVSKIHNVELNYRRHLAPWGKFRPWLLAGLRYIKVKERFELVSTDEDDGIGEYEIEADNDLFGLQVGAGGILQVTPAWAVGGRLKAGAFLNWAQQESNLFGGRASLGRAIASDGNSRTGAAGAAELGLFVEWKVKTWLILTAGYEVLYLAGLALAPDQFGTSNTAGAFGRLDNTGSAVYHGPSVGVRVPF